MKSTRCELSALHNLIFKPVSTLLYFQSILKFFKARVYRKCFQQKYDAFLFKTLFSNFVCFSFIIHLMTELHLINIPYKKMRKQIFHINYFI